MTPDEARRRAQDMPVREAPPTFTASRSPTASRENDRSEFAPDAAAVLERMERVLAEIRGTLDAAAREQRHKDFSPLRLVGAILQVIVLGLVGLAVVDWIFKAASFEAQVLKLAFAVVLQLMALTAFLVTPRDR